MVTPRTELSIRCDGEALAPQMLEPGEYTVGSGPECAVRIERPGLASRHALLTVNYDELFVEPVEDAEVRVNDRPISGYTRLWPHQRVQVGSAILELHRVKSAPGTEESLPPSAHQLARLLPPDLHRDRRYDIGGEIGQGGMGVVLDARDPALRRTVAMKVLLDQHAADHLLRFVEEAQVTGQLEHPNIPPVHELGVDENGKPYYTMKLVRGQTLREVLAGLARGEAEAEAKYPLPVLLTVFQKVCDAVAFAHEKQIIHRDLKPENIMIGRFGEVLVMDWGLAKVLDATVAEDLARRSAVTSARVEEGEVGHTLAGSVVGTPQYMSPEQAAGEVETLDARSDIYALGAILYHILALRPSVEGGSVASILGKVQRGEVAALECGGKRSATPPSDGAGEGGERPARGPSKGGVAAGSSNSPALPPHSKVPASLAAVVKKAMALDRAQRYASVPELQRDIAAYQSGFATSAERAGFWKQATLLVKRHKGVFATGFAAWLVITALAVWFVFNLRAKERRAVAGEESAKAAQAVAVREKETARQALAKSQLDLAEKEFERGKFVEAQKILDETPESFRDANWRFLRAHSRDFTTQLSIPGKGSAHRLQFLPQGDRFAARCFGDVIGIFTLTGRQIGTWFPVIGDIRGTFGIDGAGSRLALAAAANEVAVYDVATGKPVHRWMCEIGEIRDVLMSPDGGTVLVAGGKQLVAYATQTGAPLWTQPFHNVVPAFSPDGRTVAILAARAGLALKIQLLDTGTGAVRNTLEATADDPGKTTLQFNQAGDRLARIFHQP